MKGDPGAAQPEMTLGQRRGLAGAADRLGPRLPAPELAQRRPRSSPSPASWRSYTGLKPRCGNGIAGLVAGAVAAGILTAEPDAMARHAPCDGQGPHMPNGRGKAARRGLPQINRAGLFCPVAPCRKIVVPLTPFWEAEQKDRLERRLCHAVCAGRISLKAAPAIFLGDWRAQAVLHPPHQKRE